MTVLHYDHLAKHFPERTRHLEAVVASGVLDLGFETVVEGLRQRGAFPSESISLTVRSYHRRAGRQTFEVGALLAELLEHTELSGVTPDELRFPFSTFYVSLPETTMRLWGGERTQWHPVRGFYVHLDPECLAVLLWGQENDLSMGPGDDATQWAVLPLDRGGDLETLIEQLLQDRNSKDDPIIDPIMDIPAILEGSHADGLRGDKRVQQMETLRQCFRLAVNLALYLASPKAEVAERPDKGLAKLRSRVDNTRGRKRKAFADQLAKRTIIQQVGVDLQRSMRASRAEHGPVSGTWVRGHWRSYWTGAGRTTKVSRWILPHPRGVEQPEARSYEVNP